MKVFLKTFAICLIICAGCWAYTLLKGPSYAPIKPNNTTVSENRIQPKEKIETPLKQELYDIKICFLTNENTPRLVERKTKDKTLENTIRLLLKGPSQEERDQGVYSEIPSNTRLYWVREENGSLIINLSESFSQGGGATSVKNRVGQLIKTVNLQQGKKPVYLYINGKKAEYIGGEGIYLQQPLNEDILSK